MSLSTILIILKYTGTGISGAAGIWGTVSETRDKKTGRLSRWGKWALGLAIAGVVVALSSQTAEQIIASTEKQDAKDKARVDKEEQHQTALKNEQALKEQLNAVQTQLAVAREQLGFAKSTAAAVESGRTHFDKLSIDLAFELSESEAGVASFKMDLESLIAQASKANSKNSWPSGLLQIGRNFVRIWDDYKGNDPKVRTLLKKHGFLFAWMNDPKMFMLALTEGRTANDQDVRKALKLYQEIDATSIPCYYSTQTHRLIWSFTGYTSTSEEWPAKLKSLGISDLTNRWITIGFGQGSPLDEANLISCDIKFGNHGCTITNFTRVRNLPFMRFTAALPDSETIMKSDIMNFMSFIR